MQTEENYRYMNDYEIFPVFREKYALFRVVLIDCSSDFLLCSYFRFRKEEENFYLVDGRRKERKEARNCFRKLAGYLHSYVTEYGNPDLIITGIGPGSFTGVRIAVSTARNLSQFLSIPVLTLDSLALYGFLVKMEKKLEEFYILFDAKQKQVYGKKIDENFPVSPVELINYEEIEKKVGHHTVFFEERLYSYLTGKEIPFRNQYLPLDSVNTEWIAELFRKEYLMKLKNLVKFHYKEILPLYVKTDPAHQKYPEGIKK